MSIYHKLSHCKFLLQAHLVTVTKYRFCCLDTSIMLEVQRVINTFRDLYDWSIEIAESDKNHLHLLVNYTPKDRLSDIVKIIKQVTTYYVYKNCYNDIRKYY